MWETVKFNARFAYEILLEAGRRYGRDRVNRMSAAVAYRMIFAVAPLMLIAVWVFGLVIGDSSAAEQQILDRIADVAGQTVADALSTFVGSMVTGGGVAAFVGFALLLWTSSTLFLEVQNALNDVFDVPYDHTSGPIAYVKQRGLGFVWTLGLGVLVVGVWGLNLVWGFFQGLFDRSGLRNVHDVVAFLSPVVSLLVLPFLFALIFQSLTRVKVRGRALYWGSAFTSVVFIITAYGISLYFKWDSDTSASQVAGALFVILLATFVLSGVFLYGALVTKTYNNYLEMGSLRARSAPPQPDVVVATPDPPLAFVAVLGFIGGLFVGRRRRE
jgi:membrane protein